MRTSSGVIIKATEGKTTTVLGAYAMDTARIIDDDLAMPKNIDVTSAKPGGINVLNAPNDLYKNSDQFWKDINEPFLKAAVDRGDEIYLATKPTEVTLNRIVNGVQVRSGFGKEYDYLYEHGYRYDINTGKMEKNTK